jgi:tetratricopeptide (TPR) repeat protein
LEGGRAQVKLVGRILAGLLGLPLLLLGSLGLASAYMPGTELLQSGYSLLQSVDQILVDAGFDLPMDASVTIEEWLTGPLRFIVAPVGVLGVLLAGGLSFSSFGGKAGQKSGGSADEGAERSDFENAFGSSGPMDRRARKKLIKAAAALRKKGELEEAAEMLWSGKELDKAADYYTEANNLGRVAQIRHDQNRFIESAELYLRSGDHEAAGVIFAQQEEWARAGDCYLEIGSHSLAAEMYEKAEDHRKAAQCYSRVEFHRHAASAFVKVKEWSLAAESLEKVFKEESPKAKNDAKKLHEMQKIARQAGNLFKRARQLDRASAILENGECWDAAAELAIAGQRFGDAAEFYRNARDLVKASDALRQLGENEAAARLMGEHHRDRGELKEAVSALEEAGDFGEAGDIHRQLESYESAGRCYREQGDWAAAAEMYRTGGNRIAAAECYERVGRFAEAAECHALEGISHKEAELLDKAGQFLLSGEVYRREGMDDEAISVLQKVPPENSDFSRASALLGDVFQARGQLSLAIKKLQQSVDGAELDRDNMPVYYTLATILEANQRSGEAVEIYEKIMAFDYHYEDVERRLVEARERAAAEPALVESSSDPHGGVGSQQSVNSSRQPGRYQLVGELGRGGMGIVYKAKDTVLDRPVAYKVLPDSFKENPQALANFQREAKAAAKLNHPNIVTVFDTGEQDGRYYIAMEFVDGTTLKEIIRRRGVISPAGIMHVMVQLCEALAYAHEQKVVHRDIKPANAMWTRDKKVKIMDFGLAKLVEEVRNHTTVVAGTPYYMSPEQTLGKNIDHRTDIYSLGVTIFEMATGTVPFKEGNIPYHHVHTAAPDVRERRSDLPPALAAIVNRCLAKDPADRFQSTREILAEARGALGHAQGRSQGS